MPTTIASIDDVVSQLDLIIEDCEQRNDPLGYFPVLYRKVTLEVKAGIAAGFFDDGPRMEKLDIVFASRYLDAYTAFRAGEAITDSWRVAFETGERYWPIVLQHLLVGINAHINLDLGIAAAEISQGKNIQDLKGDFDKINAVLAKLVNGVEEDLAAIWPTLSKLILWLNGAENLLLDFSMELARDGAWRSALEFNQVPIDSWPDLIKNRDLKVAKMGRFVQGKGWLARRLFGIIRLGERGTVAEKMQRLA